MIVNGLEAKGIIRIDNARVYGLEESIIASGYPMQVETYDMADNSPVTNLYIEEKDYKRARHLGKSIAGSGHDCFLKGIILQFDMQVSEYIWRQWDRYHFNDYVSSQSKMHRILKLDIKKSCNKYVSQSSIDFLNELIWYYNNYDLMVDKIFTQWENKDLDKTDNENSVGLISVDMSYCIGIDFYIDYETKKPFICLNENDSFEFTKENLFKIIVSNIPCGLMLTARVTLNYLQAKSIKCQRNNHYRIVA